MGVMEYAGWRLSAPLISPALMMAGSIIRFICCIKSAIAEEQGRKLGQMDERYMKKAEDLLDGEFAVALGIPKESVGSYIESKLLRV